MTNKLTLFIALYTLALTASLGTWVFAALSLTVLSGTVVLLGIGLLSYLSEAYHSAALTQDWEVVARDSPVDPYAKMNRSLPRSAPKGTPPCDRLGAEWAIYALAGLVSLSLASGAAFVTAAKYGECQYVFSALNLC